MIDPIEAGESERRPRTVTAADPRRKSPVLAAILSAMPGLGQVYIGFYQRGFIHALTVGVTISILDAKAAEGLEPVFALFLSFFWLYNVIDAARLATLYNQAIDGIGPIDIRGRVSLPGKGGSIVGGVALIVGGLLLFLNRQLGLPLDWLKDWWPLAPVGLGVYLLAQGIRERRARG